MKKVVRELFKSEYLFVILLILAPASFFISRNYTQQILTGNALSFAVALLMGLVGCAVAATVLLLLRRFTCFSDRVCKILRTAVFAVAGVLVFPFFIYLEINREPIPGAPVLAVLCLFYLLRILGADKLNIFLATFTLISLVNIARAELSERSSFPAPPPGMPLDYVLEKKPNIYFFFLESMHDRKTLNAQYGFDMPEFFEGLERRNFTPYEDYISNYMGTLASAVAAFSMRHHYNVYGLNRVDMTRGGFVVLAENNIFRILKNNGYSINLFDNNNSYVFRRESPYVDYAHFRREMEVIPGVIRIFVFLNPYVSRFMSGMYPEKARQVPDPIGKVFSENYPRRFNLNSPSFFYIHLGAHHIGHERPFYPGAGWPEWLEEYPKLFRNGAKTLEQCLDRVLENDPDALIILAGDHGSWKYGREVGLDRNPDFLAGKSDINAYFRDNGVEPQTVGASLGEVLAAVRWPEGIKAPPRPPKGLSPVTLFPFVFYAINGKEYNESLFEENISINIMNYGNRFMIFAKDGKLLTDWQLMELRDGRLEPAQP